MGGAQNRGDQSGEGEGVGQGQEAGVEEWVEIGEGTSMERAKGGGVEEGLEANMGKGLGSQKPWLEQISASSLVWSISRRIPAFILRKAYVYVNSNLLCFTCFISSFFCIHNFYFSPKPTPPFT